ncbi:hypothetical protein [Xanthomonas sp. CFBP 7698]|uniref:hypothetical protein n=1 Tax=Xanthomonas sp. CFBP 7698 TaxID=2082399 RepID=UPI0011C451F9|nr:hypothetical protein [Xanthomonas sp. CFBP 7698]
MSEPNPKLSEIQNLPVPELAERLGELSSDELTALRALEAKEKDGGRKTALAAIDEAIAKASQPAGVSTAGESPSAMTPPSIPPAGDAAIKPAGTVQASDAPPSGAAEAPATAAEATPDWHREAYDGPLTIPQAEWRRHNIKPVRAVREK